MKFLCAVIAFAALAVSYEAQLVRPVFFKDRPASRIVGGEEAIPHSHPWQVALEISTSEGNAFCGGTLIDGDWILSAAHCCELSKDITVILGAHNVTDPSEETQLIRKSESVHVHPAWNKTTLINDICAIKLDETVESNAYIKPIALPRRGQENDKFVGVNGTATGWGKDSDSASSISPVLREVGLEIIGNFECRMEFGLIGIIIPLHESNICVSGIGGRSTCNGDSGGPLIIPDKVNGSIHVGLTSFGISFGCEKNYPAVFTRTTSFLDWIQLTTGIEIQ